MKKSTVLAASMLSCATAATAQSSVTLFGVVDAGVSHYSVKSEFYNNTAVSCLPPAIAPAGAPGARRPCPTAGPPTAGWAFAARKTSVAAWPPASGSKRPGNDQASAEGPAGDRLQSALDREPVGGLWRDSPGPRLHADLLERHGVQSVQHGRRRRECRLDRRLQPCRWSEAPDRRWPHPTTTCAPATASATFCRRRSAASTASCSTRCTRTSARATCRAARARRAGTSAVALAMRPGRWTWLGLRQKARPPTRPA